MLQRFVISLATSALGLLLLHPALAADPAETKPPKESNFDTRNLVAWCIVPFDAKKRSPAERAKMLVDLGLRRCAYDWRDEHVASFEEEILEYKKHNIEYFAFWAAHERAFALFKKHQLTPQIWMTCPGPAAETQAERVTLAASQLAALAGQTKGLGFKLGLYNHGGWGGEPANLVAVCQELHKLGHDHVGIVYNFHHGHEHIAAFEKNFTMMKPFLHCLNLNGMADPEAVAAGKDKILPIGSGKHEAGMIRVVQDSGYTGPIGILDHIESQDAAVSLKANIDGLAKMRRDKLIK